MNNVVGLTVLIYTVLFPTAAGKDSGLGKAAVLPVDKHNCVNRGRIACETSYLECGGWCPETKQCLRARPSELAESPMCPFGEAYSGFGHCLRLPAPQCAMAIPILKNNVNSVRKGDVLFPCVGFCVPKAKDNSLDWENGVCIDFFDMKCEGSDKQLITKTSDIPCEVRDTCHTCLYEGTVTAGVPKLAEGSDRCKWDVSSKQCVKSTAKIDRTTVKARCDCPPPDKNHPADVLDGL